MFTGLQGGLRSRRDRPPSAPLKSAEIFLNPFLEPFYASISSRLRGQFFSVAVRANNQIQKIRAVTSRYPASHPNGIPGNGQLPSPDPLGGQF